MIPLVMILHNNSIVVLIHLFLSLWAAFFWISERALNYLIQFLHYVFTVIAANSRTVVDILPNEHLECWQKYIFACNIYCSSMVSYFRWPHLANEFMMHHFYDSRISLWSVFSNYISTRIYISIYRMFIRITDHVMGIGSSVLRGIIIYLESITPIIFQLKSN